MTATIGADPEILLRDSDYLYRSVEGLIGGTKNAPVPIEGLPSGFGAQEDNVMLEFNIPPATTAREFRGYIYTAMETLGEYQQFDDLVFASECFGTYGEEELATKQGSMFGCSADLDAWTCAPAMPVSPSALGNIRCAGGHVHLGYSNPNEVPPHIVGRLADVYLGLQEVAYSGMSQGRRRATYGTAGRFRVKPYGIEYRTLSNSWLTVDTMMSRVSSCAMKLASMLDDTRYYSRVGSIFDECPWGEVQKAINSENRRLAQELCEYMDTIDAWGDEL